ncbi:MAG: hypothetical protein HRU12_22885 [Phaeodactylibacter sp.]|nr:hypothetical protein [Phaeodactylibacter sp.]
MTDSVFAPVTPEAAPVVAPVEAPVAPAPVATPDNLFADQLAGIKNPDGLQKYANVGDALTGAANAQDYIAQLQEQLATAKAEAAKAVSQQEIMEALKPTTPEAVIPTVTGLGEEDAAALITKMLSEREVQSTNETNERDVSSAVVAQYGDKAKEVMVAKAAELGMSVEAIQSISRQSPQAAKQLLGLSSAVPTALPTGGSINPQALQQHAPDAPRAFKMTGHGSNDLMSEWDRNAAIVAAKYK